MNLKLRADEIRSQIVWLYAACPELKEDEVLAADMIEGETDAKEFLSLAVRLRGEASAISEGIREYMKNLAERAARYERRADVLRDLVRRVLDVAGLRKLVLPEATLSIHAGRPKVLILDESKLPDIAFRREPDKQRIKELLAEGAVAGAELSNAEDILTIRVRYPEIANMLVSNAFPSKYLSAQDLQGRTVIVEFLRIDMAKINDATKLVAYFVGKQKGFVINRTNAATIANSYGDDTNNWIGGKIELYTEQVLFQNKLVPAIRVRVPPQQFAPPPQQQQQPAAPQQQPQQQPAAPPPRQATYARTLPQGPQRDDPFDDDIPF